MKTMQKIFWPSPPPHTQPNSHSVNQSFVIENAAN